ncbi:FAD-binding oxidoreductase [Reinekea sp.]|jgi:FAD/FMN-containing dehydrogenase|uniref:FAD-binding oxidoreductase n=1 Tax=Reinekea sp. TaxID=1970455 RepID=UPI002A83ED68|nr:FAD-binding oxidoreductase [Reinekea sp.]
MQALLTQLIELLGPDQILTGAEVSARPTSWFDKTPMPAGAIVRPGSTEEVAAVVKLCHTAGISIVPLGGMTGFVEGAVPVSEQIGLSLERLNRVEAINVDNRTVTVQAGLPLQALQEFAQANDLHYPVDLGARGSCTLGGMAATNAGGNEVLRYGMSREQILGLEVVLATGEIVSNLRPLLKNNTGYDLKQLFIGSEGTLGIITRLSLRLRARHSSYSTALVAVPDFKSLTVLLRTLDAKLGGRLSAFEVMWQEHLRFVIAQGHNHQAPLSLDYPYYVLIQAANYHDLEKDIFLSALENMLDQEIIIDAVIASSIAQQQALWAIRDDIECLTTGLAPYIGYDVSLPIDAMEAYVDNLTQAIRAQWSEAKVIVFGHLGDGNLHLFIHIGPDLSDSERSAINHLVYQPLASCQGSVSAEHGIGFQKKAYLQYSRTPLEIDLMRQLKKTFDPDNLFNPGAIFDASEP